jgi:hypothetical protein
LKNILERPAQNSPTVCLNILAVPPVFRFLLRLLSLYIILTFHPSWLVPVAHSQAAGPTRDQDGCPQQHAARLPGQPFSLPKVLISKRLGLFNGQPEILRQTNYDVTARFSPSSGPSDCHDPGERQRASAACRGVPPRCACQQMRPGA